MFFCVKNNGKDENQTTRKKVGIIQIFNCVIPPQHDETRVFLPNSVVSHFWHVRNNNMLQMNLFSFNRNVRNCAQNYFIIIIMIIVSEALKRCGSDERAATDMDTVPEYGSSVRDARMPHIHKYNASTQRCSHVYIVYLLAFVWCAL